ncbi:MAG TPA: periplasmic heavy metal sensor [Bacteroidales bacterium]|nr:periplasmic heavy metal sensor [Bacteroidales bacterium]HRZ50130.1 periplasmic heavy metal sensor [Bacteroidales bacterium]
MKIKKVLVAALIPAMLLMFAGNTLSAQEKAPEKQCTGQGNHDGSGCQKHKNAEPDGPFRNFVSIPDITDKQKEDIRKIRLDMIREIRSLKDQVMEKEARLRTLTRTDQPDSKAIDRVIDEIAEIQASIRKKAEKARQQIRALLNEEQKLWFDSHCHGPQMDNAGPGHPESCQQPEGKKMKRKD